MEGKAEVSHDGSHARQVSQAYAQHAMEKLHVNTEGANARKLLNKLPSVPRDSPENPSCESLLQAPPLANYAAFYVRHRDHGPGHIVIYPPLPQIGQKARIEFTTVHHVPASQNTAIDPRDAPAEGHLVIPINNITGLKKVGLSLPARLAVGWALDAEGAGGVGLDITIVRRNQEEAVEAHRHDQEQKTDPTVAIGKEDTIRLSGIIRRNELFDRLIALGDQRWEIH